MPEAVVSSSDQHAGLYIHAPFCTSICPYCDFAVTIAGEDRRREWTESVVAEARLYAHLGLVFDTVYLGGGTPSAMAEEQLAAVLEGVRRELRVTDDARLHLEANPEHVSPSSVAAWRALGVRFLSLGVQSFDGCTLAFLGRAHTAAVARSALETAVDGGFDTVSADLMYGIPGRPSGAWRSDLDTAVGSGVHHLSCYQLTIHDRTVFGRRRRAGLLDELDEPAQAELFFVTFDTLARAGFSAYEVSNFAAGDEHRSRHNLKYWTGAPYLGLGPSAHSFVSGRRWWNRSKLRLWRSALAGGRSPVAGEEALSSEQRVLEAVVLGLRTVEGVDLRELEARFGVDLVDANRATFDRFAVSGHVEWDGRRLRPTVSGLAIADTLARSIVLPC